MALDYFDQSPNFVNPDYATPEQLAQQRAYAAALMARSGEPVKRPLGAVASWIDALTANLQRNNANKIQSDALARSAGRDQTLIEALQNGQNGQQQPSYAGAPSANLPPPSVASASGASPIATPSSPKVWGDKEAVAAGLYDDPAKPSAPPVRMASNGPIGAPPAPGGAQPQAAGGFPSASAAAPTPFNQPTMQPGRSGLDPRTLAVMLNDPMVSPEQKTMLRQLITPQAISDVYGTPATQSYIGGIKPVAMPPSYQPGRMVPVSATPEGGASTQVPLTPPGNAGGVPNYAGGTLSKAFAPIGQVARDLGNQAALNKAGIQPQADAIAEDSRNANQAPQVFRAVNTILDDIKAHGDKMSWGPTAPYAVNLKKIVNNFAPGALGTEEINALAANESIEKATSTLGTLLGKQIGGVSGTDASMFQGLQQVPGAHNSQQGATALADMIKQGTVLQQKLSEAYRTLPNEVKTAPNFDYIGFKNKFYQQNPIINPLSGHDIMMDMRAKGDKPGAASTGGWGIVR